mgnify:CR=1 FL=1
MNSVAKLRKEEREIARLRGEPPQPADPPARGEEPSEADKARHKLTHLPYSDWCSS